jgi:hypothetical protein
MKRFCMLLCFAVLFSCSKEPPQKPDFILGYWNRINNNPNTKTFEIWNPDFTGMGFSMIQTDTVFKEILSIVEINDTLNLKVEGVNAEPTLFKFTEQTKTSFTCENPENPFPKKIQYSMESGKLKAVVSGDEESIEFIFVKSF